MGRDFCFIEFSIGRRGDVARNTKQGAQSIEWVEAAIEAEREFGDRLAGAGG